MSKKTRGRGEASGSPSRRRREYTEKAPQKLRVIEGGRGEQQSSRRAAPSRKVKRRRRIAFAVLTLMAAGLVTYILLGPVTRLLDSSSDLARAESQLAEEKARTQELEERKAWDLTDRFVEWEARRMGYVKPGEIPIIILDEEEENPPQDSSAVEGTLPEGSADTTPP
jgi:cell division protein FtsB